MDRKKLLVEGTVIVVSILLAFAIDALWEERKERIEEQEILAALKIEYETNLSEIETVIEFHNRARATVDELFGSTDEEIRQQGQQRRSEYVVALCNPWSFYPVLGTTEALIGAGELDLLENRQLRNALSNFLFFFQDSVEDIEYVGHDAERVWVREVELGGPWTDRAAEIGMAGAVVEAPDFLPSASTEDVFRIRNDAKLKGLVARCHLNVGYYIVELQRLRAGAASILELIDESD
ncbi:MAG: hypothetical protein P8008_04825 [Gammaproteobacteria bacterium]